MLDKLEPLLNYAPTRHYPMGIGDDAAIRQSRGRERVVLTTDTSVQDVHFSLKYMTLAEVGYKAMVTNVSDCAAMGALPEAALVNMVFPRGRRGADAGMRLVYRGFNRVCTQWGFPIIGGDLSGGPCWMIAITVIGRMAPGTRPLLRRGGRHGDVLWMTGRPGASAAGLAALRRWGRAGVPAEFRGLALRHIRPRARVEAGVALAADLRVHAAMDCSDGISKDAATLGYESGLGAVLEADALAPSPAMERLATLLGMDPMRWVLHGGEDYELLVAAAPGLDVRGLMARVRVPCAAVGRLDRHCSGLFLCRGGRAKPLRASAWDHLR